MELLKILQGDSIEMLLEVEGESLEDITQIEFQCHLLELSYLLRKTTDAARWILSIPAADTQNLRLGQFKYNLVATFNSGRVKTVLYQSPLEVIFKDNKWKEAR